MQRWNCNVFLSDELPIGKNSLKWLHDFKLKNTHETFGDTNATGMLKHGTSLMK